MNYLELLEGSYRVESKQGDCGRHEISRLEYLSSYIFNFATYCDTYDDLFAKRAVEVCNAITERTTFEYIKDEEQHMWFILMCNMPFFADRIEWGSSIRGAWWDSGAGLFFEYQSCGLWSDGKQLWEPLKFDEDEWEDFMRAIVAFAKGADTSIGGGV